MANKVWRIFFGFSYTIIAWEGWQSNIYPQRGQNKWPRKLQNVFFTSVKREIFNDDVTTSSIINSSWKHTLATQTCMEMEAGSWVLCADLKYSCLSNLQWQQWRKKKTTNKWGTNQFWHHFENETSTAFKFLTSSDILEDFANSPKP